MCLTTDHDVLGGRELVEELGVLERARHADQHRVARLAPDQLAAVAAHRAGLGSVVAGERVEQRRLAGPVGTDDRLDRAFEHVERDGVDRGQAAEALGDLAYLQQAHAVPTPLRRRRHAPAKPRGARTTTKTIASP